MGGSKRGAVVGLDTSVVVRLLVGEPAGQAERALRFLEELVTSGGTAVVSDLVVAEVYFALQAHYEVPRKKALTALSQLLQSRLVRAEPGGSALASLKAVSESARKPGFVDRLIHEQYMKTVGRVASFDKAWEKLDGVTVLRD